MVRVPDCRSGGWGFESPRPRLIRPAVRGILPRRAFCFLGSPERLCGAVLYPPNSGFPHRYAIFSTHHPAVRTVCFACRSLPHAGGRSILRVARGGQVHLFGSRLFANIRQTNHSAEKWTSPLDESNFLRRKWEGEAPAEQFYTHFGMCIVAELWGVPSEPGSGDELPGQFGSTGASPSRRTRLRGYPASATKSLTLEC